MIDFIKEFKYTGNAESFYNFVINAKRELLVEKNKYSILIRNAIDVCNENVDLVYKLNNHILE